MDAVECKTKTQGEVDMNNLNGISDFLGVLLILIGLTVAIWGLRLWQRPSSLRLDSALYRYLLIDWQTWPRKQSNIGNLTNKQIKYYGVRGILAGVLSVILGIVLMRI